jgi:pimeloyl-ACP methyl ester carboxylesterase
MSCYKTDLGTIHYFYKKAELEQKNIVFLPSFGGDSAYYNFKNIIDKLDKKYGILAIDTIGYGESIEQDMDRNSTNITQNYLDVINYLKLDNIVLFGHSMGAVYCLFLAKENSKVDSIILIEPPHIGIKEEILFENESFMEQSTNIKALISEGEVISTDFLDSTNPQNSQLERELNSRILFNGFGNESILSEARNMITTIENSSKVISERLLSYTTLICTSDREGEYKETKFSDSKRIHSIVGTHYLHWSNEKEVLKIISSVI